MSKTEITKHLGTPQPRKPGDPTHIENSVSELLKDGWASEETRNGDPGRTGAVAK
jgi:hypothetical protein